MKFSAIFLSSGMIALGYTEGFTALTPPPTSLRPSTSLQAQKSSRDGEKWGAAMLPMVAGLFFAAQTSFAAVEPTYVPLNHESTSSSILVGAVETLDFSMPSYGDAMSGKATEPSKGPPAFNPFGDFDFGKKEEFVMDDAKDKVEEKKAEPKKVEEKKVEPKKEEESPKMPEISMPSLSFPKAEAPKAETKPAPAVQAPSDGPKFEMPDMPKFERPDMPKFDVPDMPKFSMPKFNAPKMDSPPKVDMPKVDMPKIDIPKVDIPKVDLPKVNVPNPFASSGASTVDVVLDSREVRDERARLTRKDFLDADDDVKEAEAKLKELKKIRQARKETFNGAKDLACADRPGGKFICLRNPFTTGF